MVLGIDRAGVVGEDGETHQGLFDVPMLTSIPNTTIYSPSCYEELKMCMKKAIYANKGLVAVRYPRGSENATFNQSYLSTEYIFNRENQSDTLIVTYGRLYEEAYRAQSLLSADGIKCDILKLTQIYPLSRDIGTEISNYKRIVFFEESMGEGGISEKLGEKLVECSYSGDYSRVTAETYVKQASVHSCLEHLGLTCEKMAEYIRRRAICNGET